MLIVIVAITCLCIGACVGFVGAALLVAARDMHR